MQAWDINTDEWGYTLTDTDGSYSVEMLESGSYIVASIAEDYFFEYYDNTRDPNNLTPVQVTAPDDTPNINFSLMLRGSISGHVFEEDGVTPIQGALVQAWDPNIYYGSYAAYTAADGSYTIRGMENGSYTVEAHASGYLWEYYDDTYDWYSRTTVAVTAPNVVANIDFCLSKGGSISGYVFAADGVTPIAYAYVDIYDYNSGAYVGYDMTSSDGSYSVVGLIDGTYIAEAQQWDYISEYYDNAPDLTNATPITVTAPNDTPNINFSLMQKGSISGFIFKPDGVTPLYDAYVCAYDYDTGYWKDSDYSDSDGSYHLTGLTNGSYVVRTSESGYITEYYDNAYIWDDATPVQVTCPDETSDIDFILELSGSVPTATPVDTWNPQPTSTPPPPPDIRTGSTCVDDCQCINFGTGNIFYSMAGGGRGYLYSQGHCDNSPTLYFGDVIFPSPCDEGYDGYSGVAHIWKFASAAAHTFTTPSTVFIGDQDSHCYQGILLFRQDGMYGGIDPVDIDNEGTLCFDWWYDASGGSDFSTHAPGSTPTPVVPSPTPFSKSTPTPIIPIKTPSPTILPPTSTPFITPTSTTTQTLDPESQAGDDTTSPPVWVWPTAAVLGILATGSLFLIGRKLIMPNKSSNRSKSPH